MKQSIFFVLIGILCVTLISDSIFASRFDQAARAAAARTDSLHARELRDVMTVTYQQLSDILGYYLDDPPRWHILRDLGFLTPAQHDAFMVMHRNSLIADSLTRAGLRKIEYDCLPWYKKIFSRKPR